MEHLQDKFVLGEKCRVNKRSASTFLSWLRRPSGKMAHLLPTQEIAVDDAFATFDKALGNVAAQNGIAPQVQVL